MTGPVLVLGEIAGDRVVPPTLEAIGVARSLADSPAHVVVLLAGARARVAAEALTGAVGGAVRVREDPTFDGAPVAAFAAVAAATADLVGARWIVVGGTTFGRDVTGRLAARWNALAANGVTEATRDGDALRVRRPVFGGRATETLRLAGEHAVVSLRPHAFPPAAGTAGAALIEAAPPVEIPPTLLAPRRTAVEPVATGRGPGLTDASIVVSGGRGLRAPENFRLVEELAESLGAAVGASRAVTDAGWRPASLQVGQTGRAVSPQLYIAVGISGAIQHLVGMVSSRVIVAINSDGSAPIFKVADYGIVGDLFQIVPALTAEVRRVRGA